MGLRQWIFGGIGVAIIVSAFAPDGESAREPDKLQAAPIVPMSATERQLLVKKSTKGLAETQDKIEKVSYFEANKSTVARTKVGAYIAVGKEGPARLRAVADYSAKRWLFVKTIKIMADDEVVLDRKISRTDLRRDNGSDWVVENIDFAADASTFTALERVAKSKTATIRYAGQDRRHDHTITTKERAELRRVLDAYVGLLDLR
jgi:hypothetical protein